MYFLASTGRGGLIVLSVLTGPSGLIKTSLVVASAQKSALTCARVPLFRIDPGHVRFGKSTHRRLRVNLQKRSLSSLGSNYTGNRLPITMTAHLRRLPYA